MEKDKGQKIIAAIYLATHHLSDTDSLKKALRERSIELVDPDKQASAAQAIDMYLGAAVIAKLISEKNASIINFEMHRFISPLGGNTEEEVSGLFINTPVLYQKTNRSFSDMSNKNVRLSAPQVNPLNIKNNNENKDKRHEAILSFINTRKSAAIKDISALFPDLSEKTIQRELGVLVSSGKITKRGSKRWSIYMAVGA